jgi:hypothetical protein
LLSYVYADFTSIHLPGTLISIGNIKNLDLADWEDVKTTDIRQLAGDVNGDGVVNAIDLAQLLSEFNREPTVFKDADIDGNGIVNAADLTCLLAGFNKRTVIVGD